jgi:hypothetical protein
MESTCAKLKRSFRNLKIYKEMGNNQTKEAHISFGSYQWLLHFYMLSTHEQSQTLCYMFSQILCLLHLRHS